MADYYDRLETQLVALTERGAHRRARIWRWLPSLRFGSELVAVAASVLIVVVVAAAILSIGSARHAPRLPHRATHSITSKVLLNQFPAQLPKPLGPPVCESPLTAPRGGRSARGEVRFFSAPPTRTEMFLTTHGLGRLSSRDLYAVWVFPAVQNLSGGYRLQRSQKPQLLGVIEPPVGHGGHLTIAHLLSATLRGVYKLVITVQPHGSIRAPGPVALAGFINF